MSDFAALTPYVSRLTSAMERLHMSPLSRAIRELERELGLVLFVRTTRRVELTAARVLSQRSAVPPLRRRSRRRATGVDPAVVREQTIAGIPSGRFTTPGEVATLVALLASPRTANVTGANDVIDGGLVKTT